MRTTTDGLPGWPLGVRRGLSVLTALMMVVLGASGALVSAQAQEETLPPLTAEPPEGEMDLEGLSPDDWATFIGSGPCPDDAAGEGEQLASRAVVILPPADHHPDGAVHRLGAVQPLEPGETARSTTEWGWSYVREGASIKEYYAEPNSYEVQLRCGHVGMELEEWQDATAHYTGLLTFDEDSWRVTNSEMAQPTVVNLAAAVDGEPREEVTVGTTVDVTATVTPAEAAGEVELFDSNQEEPVSLDTATVDGGTATFTLDDLEAGDYVLSGVFTPDDQDAYEVSPMSSGIPLTVVSAQEQTITNLTVEPESPVEVGTEVTMTALVDPTGAEGDVQFNVDGEALGDVVELSDGEAVLTTTELPEGELSLTASFVPDDPDAFAPSTSTPVPYTVGETGPQVTAVDEDGEELGDNPVLQPDQVVTLTAAPFQPEEEVTVTIDPETDNAGELGTLTADADGTAVVEFTASGLQPGQHQLDLAGTSSALEAAWRFQIAGSGDENGGDDGGNENGDADGTADGGGDAAGDTGGGTDGGGDIGSADGTAGGTGDLSGSSNGGLASTGAFLIGPAVALGLAAVSAGYGFLRRSRRDELLTFDDQVTS